MRGLTKIFVAIICIAIGMTACFEDGGSTSYSNPNPNPNSSPGVFVTRAALVDALWNLTETPDPNAVAIASSVFSFNATNGLKIMRNSITTEFNTTPVTVVDSIHLYSISDRTTTTDDSNTDATIDCPHYIISATTESPIDIEVSKSINVQQSLESKAGQTPMPYPTSGCVAEAKFEKHGQLEVPTLEDEEQPEEDEEQPSDPEDEEDDGEDDEGEDEEEDVEPDVEPDVELDADLDTSEENPEEDIPSTYSLKLVITKYECNSSYGGYPSQPPVGIPPTK